MSEKVSLIGLVLSEVEKCNHSTTVNKEEKQLICWRSGIPVNKFLTTCIFHELKFLVKYIYYGEICHKPFCILTDDTLHDVNMAHEIQRLVIGNLNAELPHTSQVEYFSGGCAAHGNHHLME